VDQGSRVARLSVRGVDEASARNSSATCVPGIVAWIIQHTGGLEPDEAAVHTSERERFASSVDGSAPDRMVERDLFIPTVPILVPAERTGDARSPTLQEIEDGWLVGHSRRHGSAPAVPHPDWHGARPSGLIALDGKASWV